MDRKQFLRNSMIFCGATIVGSAILESCKKKSPAPTPPANVNFTVDLSLPANASLNNVGGSLQHDQIIIIRTSSSAFSALSNVCTHQGCTVSYSNSASALVCPCHGGLYDLNGNVTSGPPPSPLTKYKTSLSGTILTVTS